MTDDDKSIKCMNTDAEDANWFEEQMLAKARLKNKNVGYWYAGQPRKMDAKHGDTDTDDLNRDLYDLMILNIGSKTLTNTIRNKYKHKGYEAMQYILKIHAPGGNNTKANFH